MKKNVSPPESNHRDDAATPGLAVCIAAASLTGYDSSKTEIYPTANKNMRQNSRRRQ